MKKITPFSNATEASTWIFHNCDTCRRSGCYAKRAIDMGWITGTITQKVADYCGNFETQCLHYSSVRIAPKKKKDITPTLF